MGKYKEAMEQWVKFEQLEGHDTRAKETMQSFEKSGYAGYLRKAAKYSEAEGHFYRAAADYAMLGEKDAAFADLEKALAIRQAVVDINVDPKFDNIRSDPRFADLLRRIGLPRGDSFSRFDRSLRGLQR